MKVAEKDKFERTASFGDWTKLSVRLNERTVVKLYSPLPKDLSESINARLPHDLSTLYAINIRLLRVLRAFFQRVYLPQSLQDIELDKAIKSIREECSELADFLDYLCCNSLSEDAIRMTHKRIQPCLKNFPALEKLLILQQITQENIELTQLKPSEKAESFLQSYIDYPSMNEDSDEAIIYWLTRKKKPDYLNACLKYIQSGNDGDVNRDMLYQILEIKSIFDKRREILIKFIYGLRPKPEEYIYNDKTDITITPNSLRFLQKHAIQYLYTALLVPETKYHGLIAPRPLSDFSKLFAVLKSELVITLAYKELEQLLFKCDEFIARSSDYSCLEDGRYDNLCPLAFVSLFIFACKRTNIKPIDLATYDMVFEYLTRWKNKIIKESFDFYTLKRDGKIIGETVDVYSVSMAVHALYSIKSDLSGTFAEQTREWLLSKQHRYGYWHRKRDIYDIETLDSDGEPLYTTVMVLDALELLNEKPHPTFDTKFVYSVGKDKKKVKKQGRPQNYTDEDLKRMQNAYEEYYRECNDSKLAWNKVAKTFDAKSWNAVRVACMRLKKKLQ